MEHTRSVFVIDYFFDQERRGAGKAGPRAFAGELRGNGKTVDEVYAFCVTEAILGIMRDSVNQVDKNMKIDVLRFYGHGHPGVQIVGGNKKSNEATMLAVKGGKLLHQSSLALLRPLMTAKSRVELHGCKVGAGKGDQLLIKLAGLLGVEVRAGALTQFSTNSNYASQLEGPGIYALPGMTSVQMKHLD